MYCWLAVLEFCHLTLNTLWLAVVPLVELALALAVVQAAIELEH
jgi:hypothetical protein